MTKTDNLCIIPARGGSKRIPRKNIKTFLNKPIIAYSIEVALKSGLFKEVMVSTDDQEIAEIALKYGASVPFMRSVKAADDHATTMDVINEVLNDYATTQGKRFDFICCIYPAAPLIQEKHLYAGLDLITKKNFNAVFPIVAFGYPIWRGLKFDKEGKTNMVWPEFQNTRSQDLEKVYHDAGQWYWLKLDKIKDGFFTDNTGSIVLNELEVQDIDTYIDWEIAEIKYKMYNKA